MDREEVSESAAAGSDVRGDGAVGLAVRTVPKRRPHEGTRLRVTAQAWSGGTKSKKKNLRFPM